MLRQCALNRMNTAAAKEMNKNVHLQHNALSFQVITCDNMKKVIYIYVCDPSNEVLLLIRYTSFKLYMIELWRNLGFICHKMFISLTCTTDCGFMFWYSCEMSTGPFLVLRSYNTLRSDDWSFKGKEEHDVFVGAKLSWAKEKEECASY